MKIIDLLNKIANGEEAPKKIKYDGIIWKFEEDKLYYSDNVWLDDYCNISQILNDEVEILEEEPRNIEVCGSLFTKSEYDKLAHCEEKKIPEKLDYFKSEEQLYNMSKIILFNDIVGKINEIIDYLKSKGDE